MASEQYDDIAQEYRRADQAIVKDLIVRPFFLKMVGDLDGQSAIDFACGSGFATRLLRTVSRADHVLGVDVSAREIEIAQRIEADSPLGIEYQVGDVAEMTDDSITGRFDVATAVFLLPYAATHEELSQMARTIRRSLKPGGRFVTVLPNPDVPVISVATYELTATMDLPAREGAVRTLTYHPKDAEPFSFDQFYWSRSSYKSALEGAGFRTVDWVEADVSAEAVERFGQAFWDDYRSAPHQVGLIAEI